MRLSGYSCPHCGGTLDGIEDGRTMVFCTYCGTKLSVDYENDEVRNIIEIKQAETNLNNSQANLNNAKANYVGQKARQIEAETEHIMYKDSRWQNYGGKMLGLLLFVIGIIVCAADLLFFFSSGMVFGAENAKFYIMPMMLVGMLGVGAALLGWCKYNMPVGSERIRLENELLAYKEKLSKLEFEQEDLRNTISESGGAIFGEKGSRKRIAKKRLAEISPEITQLKNKITTIEEKLSGTGL